jgi:hypothetical protein
MQEVLHISCTSGVPVAAWSSRLAAMEPSDAGTLYSQQSMGRVRSALDNAAAEVFKLDHNVEYIDRHRFRTWADARLKIATWIVGLYKACRRTAGVHGLITHRL